MKLAQYIYYFFRSIYYRGFINTLKLLYYERYYEKALNIKTLKIENLDSLTLSTPNSNDNHHYQGASYFVLFQLFNKLPTHIKHLPFIDYGCGKGRALFVAEQCGFSHLIGIDLAKELLHDAEHNVTSYIKKNEISLFQWIYMDATHYKIPENGCVFYFFNPFGASILTKVMNNIKASLITHPREVYIIYINPLYRSVIDTHREFFIYHELKQKNYLEAIIYKST